MKPRLLDLFCGAGGAAMGYARAGFEVVGVDIAAQPNYPFTFYQADAMTLVQDRMAGCWHIADGIHAAGVPCLGKFGAVHASPPCQAYSTISRNDKNYADLYGPTRDLLRKSGLPYVIENVIGAPYESGVVLCGSMFGMTVRRHRNFETSFAILRPECRHQEQGRPYTITGHGGGCESKHSLKPPPRDFGKHMDMEWATPYEVTQAIPPAFTEFIGALLMEQLQGVAA